MGSPPLESSTSNFPGFRFSLRPSPRLTAFAVLEGELAVACIGGGKGGPPGFRGWRKARSVPRRFTTSPHEKRELTLPPGLRRSKLGRHLQLPSGQSPIGCWQRHVLVFTHSSSKRSVGDEEVLIGARIQLPSATVIYCKQKSCYRSCGDPLSKKAWLSRSQLPIVGPLFR